MITLTVTKKSVTSNQPNISIILLTLTAVDDSGPGFERDFSIEYRKGDTPAGKIGVIIGQMQEAVDNYKSCQQIFNSAQLTTAVANIQGGLTT